MKKLLILSASLVLLGAGCAGQPSPTGADASEVLALQADVRALNAEVASLKQASERPATADAASDDDLRLMACLSLTVRNPSGLSDEHQQLVQRLLNTHCKEFLY